MPRKRPKAKPTDPATRRQYNVVFKPEVAVRIDDTAEALGIDTTDLVRMIVHENLAAYEERARKARGENSTS